MWEQWPWKKSGRLASDEWAHHYLQCSTHNTLAGKTSIVNIAHILGVAFPNVWLYLSDLHLSILLSARSSSGGTPPQIFALKAKIVSGIIQASGQKTRMVTSIPAFVGWLKVVIFHRCNTWCETAICYSCRNRFHSNALCETLHRNSKRGL